MLVSTPSVRNSLKALTWRAAGVRRDGPSLAEAAESIDGWCRYALARQLSDPSGWELQNMLTVSKLLIDAALRRQESRGVHFRTDFPRYDVNWHRRISQVRGPES